MQLLRLFESALMVNWDDENDGRRLFIFFGHAKHAKIKNGVQPPFSKSGLGSAMRKRGSDRIFNHVSIHLVLALKNMPGI